MTETAVSVTGLNNLSNPQNPRGDSLASAPQRSSGDRLRQTVDQFIGLFFYGTMLKSARESRLTDSTIGFGGRGEQAFAAQLEMELAERAGRAASNKLSDAIVRQLGGRSRTMPAARP